MRHADTDAGVGAADDRDPPISVHVARLQPLEIVLLSRCATGAQADGFPALDRCAEDFDEQLGNLPRVDPELARVVARTFAMSPFPVDRLNLGRLLRPLTLVDHDAGFALWHQLVRDEHPVVRREIFEPVHRHLTDAGRAPEAGLAEEGLTLADAGRLRDAFVAAQFGENLHVIKPTRMAAALREATASYRSLATLD